MYEASCHDLGLAECRFVATAPSLKKVEYAMLAHAREEHPELVAGITAEQHEALIKSIAEAAHEVPQH